MSQVRYAADDRVILCLDGLRWVKKTDTSYLREEKYGLSWNYKGGQESTSYGKKLDRDLMYDRMRAALLERNK